MRSFALVLLVTFGSVSSLYVRDASADAPVSPGSYDVKFDEMGHNCNPPPVALGRSKLTIAQKKSSITVDIDTIPEMAGVTQKGGKINAKTVKGAVATTVQGLDARYSIAGKIDDGGILQLVLVAEYIKHDDKKAYCTQSWNVSGLRGAPVKK
jgi:hypothetical protein